MKMNVHVLPDKCVLLGKEGVGSKGENIKGALKIDEWTNAVGHCDRLFRMIMFRAEVSALWHSDPVLLFSISWLAQ